MPGTHANCPWMSLLGASQVWTVIFSFILFCFVQKQSMAFNYFPFSNQLKTELSKLSVGLQQDQEEYTIRVFDMTQCNKACHCAVQCKLRSIECSPVQPCVCASDHMLCCSCPGQYISRVMSWLACTPLHAGNLFLQVSIHS